MSDPALADSTAYTPTFTQAKATSWYDAASVIVEAVAASPDRSHRLRPAVVQQMGEPDNLIARV